MIILHKYINKILICSNCEQNLIILIWLKNMLSLIRPNLLLWSYHEETIIFSASWTSLLKKIFCLIWVTKRNIEWFFSLS